jgi:YidC/Oxa1 family membrane protein insertase
MGSFLSILDPLRDGLYHLLLAFQGVLAPLVGSHSAWLAIVALTVTVRVMLLPLALMQWRATRAMQALAPEVRELRR